MCVCRVCVCVRVRVPQCFLHQSRKQWANDATHVLRSVGPRLTTTDLVGLGQSAALVAFCFLLATVGRVFVAGS